MNNYLSNNELLDIKSKCDEYFIDLRRSIFNIYKQNEDIFKILFHKQIKLHHSLLTKSDIDILLKCNIVFINNQYIQSYHRINIFNKFIFLTDFVSNKMNRSFPYIDEGIIQYKHFDKNIVSKLKDKSKINAWDTSTGSANPLIFIYDNFLKFNKNFKIYGTDINYRALIYGKINLLLNNITSNTELILSNIDENLNKNLKFDYIWSNPPFALSPKSDMLHSYGGKFGYEKTILFLEKIKERLSEDGIAQILTYSLGNINSIQIKRIIRKIYNSKFYNIKIEILNEKLWRFNEKKIFKNPMPIENIIIRANDEYYNLEKIKSDDWLRYIKFLKQNNFTHLYYVLITVEKNKNK